MPIGNPLPDPVQHSQQLLQLPYVYREQTVASNEPIGIVLQQFLDAYITLPRKAGWPTALVMKNTLQDYVEQGPRYVYQLPLPYIYINVKLEQRSYLMGLEDEEETEKIPFGFRLRNTILQNQPVQPNVQFDRIQRNICPNIMDLQISRKMSCGQIAQRMEDILFYPVTQGFADGPRFKDLQCINAFCLDQKRPLLQLSSGKLHIPTTQGIVTTKARTATNFAKLYKSKWTGEAVIYEFETIIYPEFRQRYSGMLSTETSGKGIVVKEKDVITHFNMLLSPTDMWTAYIRPDGSCGYYVISHLLDYLNATWVQKAQVPLRYHAINPVDHDCLPQSLKQPAMLIGQQFPLQILEFVKQEGRQFNAQTMYPGLPYYELDLLSLMPKLQGNYPHEQVEEEILSVISEMLHISFIVIQIIVKDGKNLPPVIRVIGFDEDAEETQGAIPDVSSSSVNKDDNMTTHGSALKEIQRNSSVSAQGETNEMETTVAPTKKGETEVGNGRRSRPNVRSQ